MGTSISHGAQPQFEDRIASLVAGVSAVPPLLMLEWIAAQV